MRKILLGFLALLVLGFLGVFLVLPGVNLAGFVAPRLQAALGRPVAIERLTLKPGAWARIDATGIVLGPPANPPGRIRTVTAEVALGSLLNGPPRLRHVLVEDAAIDLTPFLGGGGAAAASGATGGEPELPQVADATLRRVDLIWPGESGPQRGHIEELTLAAPDAEGRLHAAGKGNFAGQPFSLEGGTEAMPHAGQPARAKLALSLGEDRFTFDGSLAEPLAFDGIDGAVALKIASLPATAKLAGLPSAGMAGGLTLAGKLGRQGAAWSLSEVSGDLAGAKLSAPRLAYAPGAAGGAPRLDLNLDLTDLDVGKLYGGLGRAARVKHLKLVPGPWIGVVAEGVSLANIAGGSQPQMVTLGRLAAEVDPATLTAGPPVLRKVAVENLAVLLEKDKQQHRNWRFGARAADTGPAPANAKPDDRSGLPLLLDATLRNSDIVIRTTSGKPLTLHLAELHWTTPAVDQKVALTGKGSWQGVPVALTGTLDPVAVLRQTAKPYPATLKFVSGRTTLEYTGTFTDPLNAEGAKGRLHLVAPGVEETLALAGVAESGVTAALDLAGAFEHHGATWKLSAAQGQLSGSPLKVALLEFLEGASGKADAVALDIEAARLDLNRMLAAEKGGEGGGNADLPLHMDPNPDPRIEAKLRLGELIFNKLRAQAVRFDGALQPNRITLRELALTAYSARVTAKGDAKPAGGGARVDAAVTLHDGDIGTLRQAFGLRDLPVNGQLKGEVVVTAQGHHLAQAAGGADISAVVALHHATIPREVMQYASQNLGALFNKPVGLTPVSCLLAVANMRAGVGEVAPLRLRSADGTLAGLVTFDIWRKQMDIVIGTDSKTTGSLALDIPVRIAGSFADPVIRPATWSAEGRAKLAASNSVARVPPALRREAQQNPCFTGR
jgi:AsmA family protein